MFTRRAIHAAFLAAAAVSAVPLARAADLAVATGQNVREPYNRRVTIAY